MSQPSIYSIKVTYTIATVATDLTPIRSYFDLQFAGTSIFGSDLYDAWCLDKHTNIGLSSIGAGKYTATLGASVYSINENQANFDSIFPNPQNWANLDEIDWLLRQNFSANGYTFGEVQAAIWDLLGDDWKSSTTIGYTAGNLVFENHVADLVSQAGLHDGYAPVIDITDADTTNDNITLLLATFKDSNNNGVKDASEVVQQPLIIQVKSAAIGDYVWHDVDADGLQAANESGIAGALVKLVRDNNNDGDFDDAGEVLQTTNTDSNGFYKFIGLAPGADYQVQFFTPTGYDAVSPRQADGSTTSGVNSDASVSDVIVLAAGEYNRTIDAGFYKSVSVGDYVWNDTDQDGVQDGTETGISGVTLTLTGVTGSGQSVTMTTATAADGSYYFANLQPGSYQVTVDTSNFAVGGVLEGYNPSPVGQGGDPAHDSNASPTGTTPAFLTSGADDYTLDFGYYKPPQATASIGDRVWEDKNANGVQDNGEIGIPNAKVELYACVNGQPSGMALFTTTTDASGNYAFSGLTPGDYIVKFITPTGYELTSANVGSDASDSDAGTGGLSGCYTLASGESNTTVDAGFYRNAAIGDRVWVDSNANGVQDSGEMGKSDVTVKLYTCVNGQPGVEQASTTTDSNGNYSFSGLKPGDYIVQFIAPTGYVLTSANIGADDLIDSDAGGMGYSACYNLESGETDNSVDAGLYQGASIGDRVWEDKNANGVQDNGEIGIANATVELYACVNGQPSGMALFTTTTDASGNYAFSGLTPGDYIVKFITPTGYELTSANVGSDASDSDAGTGGLSGCYTLASGESNTTVDAGFYRNAAIGDRVWVDSNANGVQDSGEMGKSDVTVKLYTCVNGQPGVEQASTTTDSNGNYSFSGLKPGDYIVQFIAPTGYVLTSANIGADDLIDSDAGGMGYSACYNLESGETDNSVDAGLIPPSIDIDVEKYVSIDGGSSWHDADTLTGPYLNSGIDPQFKFVVTNIGNVALSNVDIVDDVYGTINLDGSLAVGESVTYYKTGMWNAGQHSNTATATGDFTDGNGNTYTDSDSDKAHYFGSNPSVDIEKYVRGRYLDEHGGGDEGLTPGFWKTHSEYGPAPLSGWPETGYDPDQSYESIFGVSVPGTPTLLEALGTGGGGLEALMRHSAAALLNASHPSVDYFYTVAQVISMTQAAIASSDYDTTKNLFAMYNELGADLNTPDSSGSSWVETPDYDADEPTGPYIPVGGEAIFTYVVKNTGNVDLNNVNVFDDRIPTLTYKEGDADSDGILDVGETWTYTAKEMVQPGDQYVNIGTVQATDYVTGRLVSDADAAHYTTAALTQSLGDRVWLDANANGVQDGNESGVAGVTVHLRDANGNVMQTTTTDANGFYLFEVSAGTYSVAFVKPAGYSFTTQDQGTNDKLDSDANQTSGITGSVVISAGEQDLSVDAGLVVNASIDIEKYVRGRYTVESAKGDEGLSCEHWEKDADKYGSDDCSWNDTGYKPTDSCKDVFGVEVEGCKTLNDLLCSTGDGKVGMMREATAGLLNACKPSVDYAYSEDEVISKVQQACTKGEYDKTRSDFATCNDKGADLSDISDRDADEYEDGRYQDNSSDCVGFSAERWKEHDADDSSSSYSWLDTGYRPDDECEQVFGVKIDGCDTLYDALNYSGDGAGGMLREATAALLNACKPSVDYSYSKDQVLDMVKRGCEEKDYDTVRCQFEEHNGDSGSYSDSEDDRDSEYDSDDSSCSSGSGNTSTVVETANYDADDAPGLYLPQGGEAIFTYVVKNTGSVALGNIKVVDDRIATLTFVGGDTDGDNQLDIDETWTYTAKETTTPGLHTNIGTVTGTDTLTGKQVSDADAANYTVDTTKQSLGDRVWQDCNGNGVQDSGEKGFAGVTVKLLSSTGAVLATTTTDSEGSYLFSDLATGSYAIQVVAPDGYTITAKDQGTDDQKDSDADPTTGKTAVTSLASGENDMSWDVGLVAKPICATFDFSGNSSTDGTDGNTRTYTVNGITVTASSFSYYSSSYTSSGSWSKAYLGSYSGGLGVTDSSESGSGTSHTVDNYGQKNYVVFQFSQDVIVDKAYLGYVSGDSDMTLWIGKSSTSITSMSNSVLSSMSFNEVNTTSSSSARTADFNASENVGNVLIIAAKTDDSNDYFKIDTLSVCTPVTSCQTPTAVKACIGDRVWLDENNNGVQDSGEAGISNVSVKLLNASGSVVATTTTDSSGNYLFSQLDAGDYKVQVVKPSGYYFSAKDQGGNDLYDSDVDSSGYTALTTLTAGEDDRSWDAGLYKTACISDRVWNDKDGDRVQDSGEDGLNYVKVSLKDESGKTVCSTYSDKYGNYKFSDLNPGKYCIEFDRSTASNYSSDSDSDEDENDDSDSDYSSSCSTIKTSYFTLSSGENESGGYASVTPIVIDLNGDGVQTVARADSKGSFDLFGNGSGISSGWISGEDGFLAIDSNANGRIDDISELFGGLNKGDGFAKLASFDSNADGVVNAADARFDELRIWRDINGNHQTDGGELMTLAEAGVASVNAGFVELPFMDANGNLHLERSSATLADGSTVDMTDVYFNIAAEDAQAAGIALPTLTDLLSSGESLDGLFAGLADAPVVVAAAPVADTIDTAALDGLKQLVQLYDQTIVAA